MKKDNPSKVLLMCDYKEGRRGRIVEIIMASIGILVIVSILVVLFVLYRT